MSFEQYYTVSDSEFLFYAFIGFLAMEVIVGIAALMHREFTRAVVIGGLIAGVIVGLFGAWFYCNTEAMNINTPIVQSNIEKKYDVQEVTFDFRTSKAGGYNWTPTQSGPQRVVVRVNGSSRAATLTQNPQTAEPTLVDIDTNKEISLNRDASQ